jgi:hypothetical protein
MDREISSCVCDKNESTTDLSAFSCQDHGRMVGVLMWCLFLKGLSTTLF